VEKQSEIDWWIWRPVPEYASLIEVQTQWSLDDLCDCHEVMDIRQNLEIEAHESQQRET